MASLLAAFLAKLPEAQLLPLEVQLRESLLRSAALAAKLLPPGGAVAIQDWVEHRMPDELVLRANARGRVVMLSLVGNESEDNIHASDSEQVNSSGQTLVQPVAPGRPPPSRPPPSRLGQIRTQPGEPVGPPPSRSGQIRTQPVEPVGPPPSHLGQKRRQPEEPASLAPPTKQAHIGSETFIQSLPVDAFTEDEARLRDAILDFLRTQHDQKPVTLLECSRRVEALAKFLLTRCSLLDWILGRLGDDVMAEQDATGQWSLQPISSGLDSDKHPEPNAEVEAFFSSLPEDDFTTEEEDLQIAIDSVLQKWDSKDPPNISSICTDAAVRKARIALLGDSKFKKHAPPNGRVPITMWLDRRLGHVYDLMNFGSKITFIGWKGTIDEEAAIRFASQKQERKMSGQDSTSSYLARNPHIRSSRKNSTHTGA